MRNCSAQLICPPKGSDSLLARPLFSGSARLGTRGWSFLFLSIDAGREVLRSARAELLDRSVTAHTELSSDLPFIEAHQSQLHQVISNLVQNAIEAMSGTTGRDRVLRVKTDVQGQKAIIVAVKDT